MSETTKINDNDNNDEGQPPPPRPKTIRRQASVTRTRQRNFRGRGKSRGARIPYSSRTLKQTAGAQHRVGENPLFDKLCEYETLLTAFQNLWKGRTQAARRFTGAADFISLERFKHSLEANLRRIAYELRSGKYRPGPINMFEIPKPGGGVRLVSVLTVKERLLQRAVLDLIEPLFEPYFLECSYAFRPERSTQTALMQVERYYAQGLHWVVDADIESFFDRIPRTQLLNLLATRISDQRLLALLELWLDHTPKQMLTPILANETQPEAARTKTDASEDNNGRRVKAEQEQRVQLQKIEREEKRRGFDLVQHWLENGLDWGIEQLEGSTNPYRVTPYSSTYYPPRRAYYTDYDEEEEDENYAQYAGDRKINYSSSFQAGLARKEERTVKNILRRYGPDGMLLGLSAARKVVKYGLPHLPGGLGGWVVKGGLAMGAVGATGYWVFNKWRKAPTLYQVETAHFQHEALNDEKTQKPAYFPDTVAPKRFAERADKLVWNRQEVERCGIAQGSILSPFFSNVYLHEFDRVLTAKGYKLVRFADDMVILCDSQREAFRAMREAEEILDRLGLNFKPSKTRVSPLAEGFRFLGVEFGSNGRWKNIPNGSLDGGNVESGHKNGNWLDVARKSWLGRTVRTRPGVVQKGRRRK